MRLEEILLEMASSQGTFAGVRFTPESALKLHKFAVDNKVPELVSPEEMHVTLLYSRKYLPEYQPLGTFKKPLTALPKDFTLLGEDKDALVVLLDCPEIVKRHNLLMQKHKATWDYPDYKPHVTLSYAATGFDMSELYVSDLGYLKLELEYMEDLALDE